MNTPIEAVQHHVKGIVSNMDDCLRLRPMISERHFDEYTTASAK
jgi:hypothetical protein